MQHIFVQARINYLHLAIDGLNTLTHLFNKNDTYLDKKIIDYLDNNIQQLKQQQHKELLSSFESVKATMQMAMQGIDPYSLEKIKIGKNTMIKTVCYKVLQQLQAALFPLLEKNLSIINQANELMKQLLLSAIQQGKLNINSISFPLTDETVETVWANFLKDDSLKMFAYNIKLIVIHQDAMLLIASNLNLLKS